VILTHIPTAHSLLTLHSRDPISQLISHTTPACFSTFHYVPILFLMFSSISFLKIIINQHLRRCTPQFIKYHLKSEVAIMPAVFNPLPTSTNREAFEKQQCIKVASMINTENLPLRKEAITCNHRVYTFRCQQR